MSKPKVVFVVGHSNWGKSQTLCALTHGSHRVRRTKIDGIEYFIRRMSNDDQPEGFVKRMKAMHPDRWPQILAAVCPDFDDPEKDTAAVLQSLRDSGYKLYFWVLGCQYGTNNRIPSADISRLRSFGDVEIFDEIAEADVRARKFKAYIIGVSKN
ncbi:hypothetical protein [Pandoraea sp. CB10b_02]|uniref:hypothetical protein n=1 Tax=Pandoraea sp. CB10b_02 TaxID=2014535 RepID=UPI00257F5544|nr:hypothetical protein [Pandoraea sp. CB10b_02]